MGKIGEVYNAIDKLAPFVYAEQWDNSGLLIGDLDTDVLSAVVTLDITNDAIDFAISKGANLIVSHHPVIFSPLKAIPSNNVVYKLINNGISVISAHTNLDASDYGPDAIAVKRFGIKNVEFIEKIADGFGIGRIGNVEECEFERLITKTKSVFECSSIKYFKNHKTVKKIALCCGAGSSYATHASGLDADVYITGDIKHSAWIDAINSGISLIEVSHYDMEKHVVAALCERLNDSVKSIAFTPYSDNFNSKIING